MRKPARPSPWLCVLGTAGLFLTFSGCGGGGSSGSFVPRPTPTPALLISTTQLPGGEVGKSYSATLSATGGRAPINWIVTSGSLPSGLTLESGTGTISGTPAADGSFSFSVQAKDSSSPPQTASKNLSLNVLGPLVVTTETISPAIPSIMYDQVLTATGGTPPYTWKLASDPFTLPPFLTVWTSGRINGSVLPILTPSVFSPTVEVRDAASRIAQKELTLEIVDRLRIVTDSLPPGAVNQSYSFPLEATGGRGMDRSWAVTDGSLPDGLHLDPITGSISGTPTTSTAGGSGVFFRITVSEPGPPAQSFQELFFIGVVRELQIYGRLPVAVLGFPYRASLGAVGGMPPYTWSITSVLTPPDGITLDPSSGEFSGIPTVIDDFSFWLKVTDSSSPAQTFETSTRIGVVPPVTIDTTSPFDCVLDFGPPSIKVRWGRPPYKLRLTAGEVPPHIFFPAQSDFETIRLEGTCSDLGSFPFTLEVSDSNPTPSVASRDFLFRINPRIAINEVDALPEGLEGTPYNFAFSATGGRPPYEWRANFLPPGLSIDSATGVIGGIPEGAFETLVVTDVLDSSNPRQLGRESSPLKITPRLVLETTRLTDVKQGAFFRMIPGFRGGTPPYHWELVSGGLPAGVSLNAATGEIAGTASTVGASNFVLRIRDSGIAFPQSDQQSLSLHVVSGLHRNDSIATATPLSNGAFGASISPYEDLPATSTADTDYYELTAVAGSVVSVEIIGDRLTPPSALDSVIEIVDANGVRFQACRDSGDDGVLLPLKTDFTQVEFDDTCLNDDYRHASVPTLDSRLEFNVPGTAGQVVTFYVHVLDFRGDARPDAVYLIDVKGAN